MKLLKFLFQKWLRRVAVVCLWKAVGFLSANPMVFLELLQTELFIYPPRARPSVLEMKYIKVKSGETLKDVLLKQSICKQHETSLILNKNHKYYFQLCHQMFSTTYKWGFFMAYGTNEEFFMQEVEFEEQFWKPILQKLTSFYEEVMLPEIVFPKVKYGLPRTKL